MPADNLSTATQPPRSAAVSLRTASQDDAAGIFRIVRDSGVLDANSTYCYLLLCRDFADTCLIACRDERIVGFVTAYRPPERLDTVFVWQIGVAEEARRQGLAGRMLRHLVSVPACRDVRFLEATVTPSNAASRQLFRSFAEKIGAPLRIGQGFTSQMFGGQGHEPEELFRIGPFPDSSAKTSTKNQEN